MALTKEIFQPIILSSQDKDSSQITPVSPDGSGEGEYDDQMSLWARRPVYKTEDGKFFYPAGKDYEMLTDEQIEKARRYFEKYGKESN